MTHILRLNKDLTLGALLAADGLAESIVGTAEPCAVPTGGQGGLLHGINVLAGAAASSVRFRWSHSWAYSWPYLTNIPAMKTLSATGPSLGPVIWKLSPGCSEKQFRFRQSFQSARPISGRPWGQMGAGKVEAAAQVLHQSLRLGGVVIKGYLSSRIDQSPVSRR